MPYDYDDEPESASDSSPQFDWRLWVTSPQHLVVTVTVVATLGLMVGYLIVVLFVFPPQNVAAGLTRVPDLVGQTSDEARERLRRARLDYQEAKGLPHAAAVGTVLAQEPLAGQMAAPGSAVQVTLSLGSQPRPVPNVVGLGHEQAEVVLKQAGFAAEVTWVDAAEDVGRVVAVRPEPGTPLEASGSVRLLVSAGPRAVQVPDLRMRSLEEARETLRRLGLQLGEISEDSASLAAPGTVIGQNPPPGTQVARATRVAVTRAVAPPPPLIVTTDVAPDTAAASPDTAAVSADTAAAPPDTARMNTGNV